MKTAMISFQIFPVAYTPASREIVAPLVISRILLVKHAAESEHVIRLAISDFEEAIIIPISELFSAARRLVTLGTDKLLIFFPSMCTLGGKGLFIYFNIFFWYRLYINRPSRKIFNSVTEVGRCWKSYKNAYRFSHIATRTSIEGFLVINLSIKSRLMNRWNIFLFPLGFVPHEEIRSSGRWDSIRQISLIGTLNLHHENVEPFM